MYKEILKEYFSAGKIPTASQFAYLIDSLFPMQDSGPDNTILYDPNEASANRFGLENLRIIRSEDYIYIICSNRIGYLDNKWLNPFIIIRIKNISDIHNNNEITYIEYFINNTNKIFIYYDYNSQTELSIEALIDNRVIELIGSNVTRWELFYNNLTHTYYHINNDNNIVFNIEFNSNIIYTYNEDSIVANIIPININFITINNDSLSIKNYILNNIDGETNLLTTFINDWKTILNQINTNNDITEIIQTFIDKYYTVKN